MVDDSCNNPTSLQNSYDTSCGPFHLVTKLLTSSPKSCGFRVWGLGTFFVLHGRCCWLQDQGFGFWAESFGFDVLRNRRMGFNIMTFTIIISTVLLVV